ncbi:MAG: NAD(P)/FAD-dependent oxidoreductase [Bacteroidota bacterium]
MLNIEQLSYWERKTFLEDIDFVVIGAGIVGYSTALHLRKTYPSAKITILERGYLPSGASSKNAGFACFGSVTELLDDLDRTDENRVWETVARRWEGLQYLQSIISIDQLKLETHGSWDLIMPEESAILNDIRSMIPYLNQCTEKITGHSGVYSEDQTLIQKFGFNNLVTSFYNKLEGQLDTGSMIRKFWQICIEKNIDVLFGIQVEGFNDGSDGVIINTTVGEIKASNLMICTNGFARELLGEDVKPARGQVIVTERIPDLHIQGTFHYDRGYYYFRNIDNRILLGGGRNLDFEGETTTEMITTPLIMNKLTDLLHNVILPGKEVRMDYSWSGIMGVGSEKSPIIKKISPHVGIGVRMGGMGVAIGSQVGKELAELF